MRLSFFLFFSIITAAALDAQPGLRTVHGSISGVVIDSASGQPVEYANILLYSSQDSSYITGAATGTGGRFIIPQVSPGRYYIEVKFIGFEEKIIDNVTITRDRMNSDLGTISITSAAINLDNIVVEGQRSPVSFQLDKKVIDVDQMQTVVSGNASDVLANVPSVTVDIEGNVSLRGSSNFTVLIDGRPTVLDAQDALQQIPASSIGSIEIITNPSARYDPEGVSGIINIVMKKNEIHGLSAISNLNAGLNDKYGGDFLFEYRNQVYSANLGLDYNRRLFPGTERSSRFYSVDGSNSTVESSGNTEWGRTSFGLKGGIDLTLDKYDLLKIGGRYGSREMIRNSSQNIFSESNGVLSNYLDHGEMERSGNFYDLNLSYTRLLNESGHKIESDISYSYRDFDEETITETVQNQNITNGRRTTEAGPSNEIEGRIDYTLPFDEFKKFEAGYVGEVELSDETNDLFEFNPLTGSYVSFLLYSNDVRYIENEHALYSTFSTQLDNFGIQAGIRGEYTYRRIELKNRGENFKTDRWDYFPTVHASYKIAEGHQLMASYTRRIRRPGGWALEPFQTWFDANNVRQGNPALRNENIDSYELGLQTYYGDVSVTAEAYYRINHNKIENVRSAYSENVTLTTFQNVGTDYALGTELMFNFGLFNFWNISLMGNFFNYRIEGALDNLPFNNESFTWNSSLNNSLKIGSSTQVQLNTRYNSPRISSQERHEEFFTADLSLRQDFLNKTLSLILQMRDIFSTEKREFTTAGEGLRSYNYFERESPTLMFTVRYQFNTRERREERRQPEEEINGEEF